MDQDFQVYLRQRESSERAAAEKATCPQAQRVHQELAAKYAALIRQAEDGDSDSQAMTTGGDQAGSSAFSG